MVASLGTDLERRIGDYMSGGHPATHGHEKEFETETRKPYEVSDEAQTLYKTIIKDSFKPKVHRETIKKHEKAHQKALEVLIEKTEKFEKDQHGHIDEFNVKEALAHALIKYKKEAGLPVSEEEGDFHQSYQAVDTMIERLRQEGKIDVDNLINEGKYSDLLRIIHQNEYERVKKGRLTFYKELVKAHLNETGHEMSEGELGKIGRSELIEHLLIPYHDQKMATALKTYTGEKAKEYHKAHADHGHGGGHGGGHTAH